MKLWRIIPIIVFLALCVFLWRGLSLHPNVLPSAQIGKKVPQFTIKQLQNPELTFEPQQMFGKVVLLNVWASWCEACVEEQSFLMQLAKKNIIIFGLNYKDKTKDATKWLQQWGNPYQVVGQDKKGLVAIDLGVYGAPETFVLDKQGIIRYRHVGVINQQDWNNVIAPLMQQLEQQA